MRPNQNSSASHQLRSTALYYFGTSTFIWAFAQERQASAQSLGIRVSLHMCVLQQAQRMCVCGFGIKSFTPDLKIRRGISKTHPPPGTLSRANFNNNF